MEHREQYVASASSEADERGVVFPAFGSLAVVVGATGGVVQRGEGRKEQRAFEFAVS